MKYEIQIQNVTEQQD